MCVCERERDVCVRLTVQGRDNDCSHELCGVGVGAFAVQHGTAGADLARGAVDGVEGVGGADGVHHCAIVPIVWVHCQHLSREERGEERGRRTQMKRVNEWMIVMQEKRKTREGQEMKEKRGEDSWKLQESKKGNQRKGRKIEDKGKRTKIETGQ